MAIGKGLDCVRPVKIFVDCPNVREGKVQLRVPCGRCVACRMRRSREWALRLECESKYYDDICFTTLTYDELNIPYNLYKLSSSDDDDDLISDFVRGKEFDSFESIADDVYYFPTLYARDLQLFIKRLRKRLDYPIKYFAVGEYGTKRQRPHYHIMFFGLRPVDWYLIGESWNYGFVMNKPFYPETCVYVAGYVQKKLYGSDRNMYRLPEFLRCSHGIGERWLMENYKHIDPDNPIMWVKGFPHALPRFFRKKLVDIGYLPELDILEYVKNISDAENELTEFLYLNGIDERTFYLNREKILNEKIKKKNVSRDTNNEF